MTASGTVTVACVQHCAGDDVAVNLARLSELIDRAAQASAEFIALPEACDYLSGESGAMRNYAQPAESHEALRCLTGKAREHGTWLLIGSLTVRSESGAVVNRSMLIDAAGSLRAWYDKVHMFDANVPGMKMSRESDTYTPGELAVTAWTPWSLLGMTVCYDLRFPHLYRSLAKAGAGILSVPAAFTKPTGEAHWHTLLRSRAIENGCFVVAPAQWGNHYDNRFSYGHSLIIDPWGTVLADAGERDGLAIANLQLSRLDECRRAIGSLHHDRPFEMKAFSS